MRIKIKRIQNNKTQQNLRKKTLTAVKQKYRFSCFYPIGILYHIIYLFSRRLKLNKTYETIKKLKTRKNKGQRKIRLAFIQQCYKLSKGNQPNKQK